MNLQTVQSLLQMAKPVEGQKINLVRGQILFGKILKLFPNDSALVQLGGVTVHAKLEASLVADHSYWFQVVQSKGVPQLKVLQTTNQIAEESRPSAGLLENLGLSFSKTREMIVRSFMSENIPFSKEMITKGGEWLKATTDKQAGIEVLKQMALKQLPLTRTVYEALLTARQAPPVFKQLGQLATAVHEAPENFSSMRQLRQLLSEVIPKLSASGTQVNQSLQQAIRQLGLTFEHDLFNAQTAQTKSGTLQQEQQTLKSLLMQVSQHTQSPDVKQHASRLLSHITAQQLTAVTENGPFMQTVFQLPLQWGSYFTDVTVKWEGKKQKGGSLDPDFCRILFYLQLQHLQETVVDVNIQKRLINIRIFNDSYDLRGLMAQFEPVLRAKLETAGYQLSSVNQVKETPVKTVLTAEEHSLSGVDLRI